MQTSQCAVCGNAFPRRVRNGQPTLYCSTKCGGVGRRTKHPRPCEECGKIFAPLHSDSRFCSVDCRWAKRRAAKLPGDICTVCGVEFFPHRARADKPQKFCSKKCMGISQRGPLSPTYKGPRLTKAGYLTVRIDKRITFLHRVVMAEHLGRPLARDEFVHHRDGCKTNNAIENLELVSREKHDLIHAVEHAVEKGWSRQEIEALVSSLIPE